MAGSRIHLKKTEFPFECPRKKRSSEFRPRYLSWDIPRPGSYQTEHPWTKTPSTTASRGTFRPTTISTTWCGTQNRHWDGTDLCCPSDQQRSKPSRIPSHPVGVWPKPQATRTPHGSRPDCCPADTEPADARETWLETTSSSSSHTSRERHETPESTPTTTSLCLLIRMSRTSFQTCRFSALTSKHRNWGGKFEPPCHSDLLRFGF